LHLVSDETRRLTLGPTSTEGAAAIEFKLEPLRSRETVFHVPLEEPWPEAVNGELLLNELRGLLSAGWRTGCGNRPQNRVECARQ